jgi:hypothetical protein
MDSSFLPQEVTDFLRIAFCNRPILRNSPDFNQLVVFLQQTSTIFSPTLSTGFFAVPSPAVCPFRASLDEVFVAGSMKYEVHR